MVYLVQSPETEPPLTSNVKQGSGQTLTDSEEAGDVEQHTVCVPATPAPLLSTNHLVVVMVASLHPFHPLHLTQVDADAVKHAHTVTKSVCMASSRRYLQPLADLPKLYTLNWPQAGCQLRMPRQATIPKLPTG
jgi:hypothetical protein